MDRESLRDRAVKRGLATWQPLDQDFNVNDLADQEATLNILGKDSILQGLVALDEAANFDEGLRDRLYELDILTLEQDQQIALDRFIAEKQAFALRIAGEFLLLEAKEYDVLIQGLIMDAREYAAAIDREGIELQKQRALMDLKKEGAHLQEVEARILLEMIERRNQEIELAKAKVEVAKANVRAILADIQAQEADVRVIRAQLEVVKTEADKAGLIADVAQIMADIVVRGLAWVKLAVETAEIDAAFGFIESRLSDMLEIATIKLASEEVKLAYEKLLNAEVALMEAEQREQIDIEKLKMSMAERLLDYEQGRQKLADACARALKITEEAHKEALAQVKSSAEINHDKVQKWSEASVVTVQAAVSRVQKTIEYQVRHYGQKIIKGFYSAGGGSGNVIGSEGMIGVTATAPATSIPDVSVSGQRCSYEEPYL